MKELNTSNFQVVKPVKLAQIPTRLEIVTSKKENKKSLKKIGSKLSNLQDIMYAHNRYGVLICLQGMDTAGKDSLIREVFSRFNPRGCVVHSYKTPTSKELQHDYLWRHYVALPEKGKYTIFNRSHYENVLVTRVNPQYLLYENIPGIEKTDDVTDKFWEMRFRQIKSFEKHIAMNGIIVFKFFLHLSKEEQRLRLLRRLEMEKKNWKFSAGDLTERTRWEEYQQCYEEAINMTSVPHAPWYVIPADDKPTARLLVAKIILERMSTYTDIVEPQPDDKLMENIEIYIEKLRKKDI